ncbi:LOW QUALITY PROTEIN: hypothetical protein Cgig2_013198 [Carnegiea gigantea]|uniref:Uncharacterized protein n=1 Tax=Carnegiea gigantea TaxID=171969 RepID=A0A9Q1KQK6_9CARY|nr:LOW QUALITY PROTEIN: hypothetical protein Cgig2_013198 [Carnegiea gigantea]
MTNRCLEQVGVVFTMKEEAIKAQCIDLLQGKGVMAFTPLSTSAERLKVVEIDLEKDRTRTKRSKVNVSWMKSVKKKLIKAFGSCVIENNQPFTVVDSIYTNPLLNTICEVGQDRLTNYYIAYGLFISFINVYCSYCPFSRYYFNPKYMYREHQQVVHDTKVRARVQRAIISQSQDSFGTPLAQSTVKNTMLVLQALDGSGDGGNGGNRGGNDPYDTSQSSKPSSRDVSPIMSDHNSRKGEEYEEETIAHTYHRLKKAKDKVTKVLPNYDNHVTHRYTDEQQMPSTFTAPAYCNWSCGSDSRDGGPYNYGYNQTNIGVHRLTNLTPLNLVVNYILLNPIQVPKIMTIFKFSTTGLSITRTIIITVPQFMAEI